MLIGCVGNGDASRNKISGSGVDRMESAILQNLVNRSPFKAGDDEKTGGFFNVFFCLIF